MLQELILPMVVTIVAGIILLTIEYRTSWFQRHLSRSRKENGNMDQRPHISGPNALDVLEKSVTPIEDLPSPIGDWFQVAAEVRSILWEIYGPEQKGGDYMPSVELMEIKPKKNSNACELTFDITSNFEIGRGYVTVEPTGRIVEFKFEY